MILKELWLRNWQLFAGDHHIDFEGRVSPYFIRGTYNDSPPESNGAGKSALIEAVLYLLYGHHRFSVASSLIFNDSDEMLVRGRFTLDNGTETVIERGLTKSGGSRFEVSGCVGDDRQAFLEKLIGTSLKDFLLTRFIMQDDLHAFVKMKSAERKTRFREWLDITHWEKAENVAKADLKVIEDKLTTLDAELNIHRVEAEKTISIEPEEILLGKIKVVDEDLAATKARWENLQARKAEVEAKARAAQEATKFRLGLAQQIYNDELAHPSAKVYATEVHRLDTEIAGLKEEKVKVEKAVSWIREQDEKSHRVERERSAVEAATKTAARRAELQERVNRLQEVRTLLKNVGKSISEGRGVREKDSAVRELRAKTLTTLRDFKGTCPIDTGKCPRDMADAAAALDKEIEARDNHLENLADLIAPLVAQEKELEVEQSKLQEDERYLQACVGETVEAATTRLKSAEATVQAMPPRPEGVPEHGILKYEEELNKHLQEAQSTRNHLPVSMEAPETIAARLEANRKALAGLPDVPTSTFDYGTFTKEENALRDAEAGARVLREDYLSKIQERKTLSSIQDKAREKVTAEEFRRGLLVADQTKLRYVAYMFGPNGIPSYQTENAFIEIENAANEVLMGLGKTFRIELKAWRELKDLEENCAVCGAKYPPRSKTCACGIGERKRKRRDEISLMMKEGTREAEIDADSGGRRTLMAFALRMGLSRFLLRRRGGEGGALFLDEIFGALDKVNSRSLLSVIADEGKMFPQIFVISHTDLVDSPPGSVLTVTRAGDRSSVEWET